MELVSRNIALINSEKDHKDVDGSGGRGLVTGGEVPPYRFANIFGKYNIV
jgi:hypothetical protein